MACNGRATSDDPYGLRRAEREDTLTLVSLGPNMTENQWFHLCLARV